MKISELYVYPVKGLRGHAVSTTTLTRRGLSMDRRWMVVQPDGMFVTQRQLPSMARLVPTVTRSGLKIRHEDSVVETPCPGAERPRKKVRIWGSEVVAALADQEANRWISEALGQELQLVYMPDETRRPTNPARSEPGDHVSFADGYPVLIANQSSLEDLNRRIAEAGRAPVTMRRFRANIVVSGAEPFDEDGWKDIRIGDVELEVTHGCSRCKVTTVDQERGVVTGKEPLSTLATFRQRDGEVYFGVNAIPRALGTLAPGARVEVRERRQ